MKKKITVIISLMLMFLTIIPANFLFTSYKVQGATQSIEDLAYYWAPIWYQDTDDTNPQADYITAFDYDGNMIGNDNWENLNNYPLEAHIYYSLVETETHYFIGYYDFHPRDWTEIGVLQHENDLEGTLLVIRKEPAPWGAFVCLITEAHGQMYQYTDSDSIPSMNVTSRYDTIDGEVAFEYIDSYKTTMPFSGHNHSIVYVDKWGHGVHGAERWEVDGFPGGDGIIYQPLGVAEDPDDVGTVIVSYELESIDKFWDLRGGEYGSGETLGSFSSFDGDTHGEDKALLPWGWDDPNDGPTFKGEIFYNPAHLIETHLGGLGNFSTNYVYNPYAVEITLDRYKVNWDLDEGEDTSDGYFNLYLIDGGGEYSHRSWSDGVLDGNSGSQFSWIGWNKPINTWIDLDTEIPRSFYGLHYPGKPFFGIRCKEWDEVTSDPWLMDKKETHWYGPKGTPNIDGERVYNIEKGQTYFDWGGSEAYITLNMTDNSFILPETITGQTIIYLAISAGIIVIIAFVIMRTRYTRKYTLKWSMSKRKRKKK